MRTDANESVSVGMCARSSERKKHKEVVPTRNVLFRFTRMHHHRTASHPTASQQSVFRIRSKRNETKRNKQKDVVLCSPRRVSQADPLAVPLGSLHPPPDDLLVSTLGDPHALAPEKGLRVSLGVPPVLVDADHAIPGEEPKNPRPGGPKTQGQTLFEGEVVGSEALPPVGYPCFGGGNQPAALRCEDVTA